jgi:hypothetical protein
MGQEQEPMSKRPRVTKLLAVVALAASPAAANPHHASQAPARAAGVRTEVKRAVIDPWAGQPAAESSQPATAHHGPAEVVDAVLAIFGITAPRRLASGAPACGNVQTKGPRPVQCEEPATAIAATPGKAR